MKKIVIIALMFTHFAYSQIIDLTQIELNYKGNGNPKNMTKGISKIYFSADDGIHGVELWVHDITSNSTFMVKNIGYNSNYGILFSSFKTIGDILYFTPNTDFGTELWRSDGTEAGTYLLKHISDTSPNTINNLTSFNGKLFFSANDSINGNEIWISDGTVDGTTILKDINTGSLNSDPSNFIVLNGSLIFTAKDATYGREIWKSDGTTAGTVLLKDINLSNLDSITGGGNSIVLNNTLYFYANKTQIWKSDGTTAGTQLFKDTALFGINGNIIGIAANNFFVFEVSSPSLGIELWKCDGTPSGTVLLKDINPWGDGLQTNAQFATFNNKIYFTASTNLTGLELWSTDGTTTGTQLVKDIRVGNQSSNINKLTATSNYLIFSAQDGTYSYNTLWKSNGTNSGTVEIKNIDVSSLINNETSLLESNGLVFFAGKISDSNEVELFTTDGTNINTVLFKELNHKDSGLTNFVDIAILNNKIIFTGDDGHGEEPFISDGTLVGSHMIKDTNTSGNAFFTSSGYRGASYTKAGNYVFFRAQNGAYGFEISKTDGTEANTSMVKDIRVGSGNAISQETFFMEYNGIFYFKANDGIHGEEMWRSDGTNVGTYLLKDIYVGSNSGINNTNVYYNIYNHDKYYAVLNGYLYFFANDGTDNSLWRTDGTESGTIKVVTTPASGASDVYRAIINNTTDKIFFQTKTNSSTLYDDSLYSTDGTQAGTILLDVFTDTFPVSYKIFNNLMYYIAPVTSVSGVRLSKSDGTVNGTTIFKDDFNTPLSLSGFFTCGNFLYFQARTIGNNIGKIWRTDGTNTGTIELSQSDEKLVYYYLPCYQDNLLYLKNINDDKIYYVNESSTNTNSYLTTNITNSENFADCESFGIKYLFVNNNDLYVGAQKLLGGTELYHTNFDFTLNNPELNDGFTNKIVLYPNPTNNKINIKIYNDEVIVNIKIYDLIGKEIFFSKETELELSILNDGIYLVKVYTDKSIYTSKIVVKK